MHHILIVEDDPHIANGIRFNLEAEGFYVTTVGDGPAALQAFAENSGEIDLMVLDLMLPGMSGYAVCEAVRQRDTNVPVLMLSARTLTEDRVRGFNVGADVYLQKPFDLEELLSIVRNLIARRSRSRVEGDAKPIGNATGISTDGTSAALGAINAGTTNTGPTPTTPGGGHPASNKTSHNLADQPYRFGQAEVNFDTFEVTVAGRKMRLTTLEMKLLRYFIEHEGSVVTRAELLEEVWGMPHSITTRTVDNFIVNLRKYFERDPSHPRHFLSLRGTGYRFVAAGVDET